MFEYSVIYTVNGSSMVVGYIKADSLRKATNLAKKIYQGTGTITVQPV